MKIYRFLAFFVLVALFFSSCVKKDDENPPLNETQVKPLSENTIITLKGVEGAEKKLRRLKHGFEIIGEEDKIVFIDIFGTFCPPCQAEAPFLTNLQIKYADKLVIIGLSFLENVDEKYIEEHFCNAYNAHYFIATHPKVPSIVRSIVDDINYSDLVALPFSVMLKNGTYATLSDPENGRTNNRFYLGDVGIDTIEKDLLRLLDD